MPRSLETARPGLVIGAVASCAFATFWASWAAPAIHTPFEDARARSLTGLIATVLLPLLVGAALDAWPAVTLGAIVPLGAVLPLGCRTTGSGDVAFYECPGPLDGETLLLGLWLAAVIAAGVLGRRLPRRRAALASTV